MELREYVTVDGRNPFGDWLAGLDPYAAAKITIALTRLSLGNFSNVEGVGASILEYKLNFGPGYRVYFGKDGDTLIILLGGGTKRSQQNDIRSAVSWWQEYKERKKGQT